MKRLFILLSAILCLSINVMAQQVAPFNQYTEYPVLYNPSYVGIDSTAQLLLLYRNQWSGVAGAPEHGLVYFNGKLNENAGIGGYLLHESANILGTTAGYISLSYTLRLAPDHTLGFGLSAGVMQKQVLFERVRTQNMSDPALLDAGQNQTKPDGSFGIRYRYANRFEINVASQQLFGGTFGFVDQSLQRASDYELLRHYYVTGMYYIPAGSSIDLALIGTVRSVQGLQSQWDAGIRAEWNNLASATVLYRDDYGIGLMFGIRVLDALKFGYAYEIPDQNIGIDRNMGTHEISLNVFLNKN